MTSTSFLIRRATDRDASTLVAVHDGSVRELCRLHYTEDELGVWYWRTRVPESAPPERFVAVDSSGEVCGFAFLNVAGAAVDAVYVHPSCARQGVGALLLAHLEGVAKERGLSLLTVKASLSAVEFYGRAGYTPLDHDRHRFPGGISLRCMTMAKAIVPGTPLPPAPPEMPVYLVPYDPAWPALFERERALVTATLRDRILGMEHVGSTAIEGLDAKPVIDCMVLVSDIERAPYLFDDLEQLGYHYFPYDEGPAPERRWFCKPSPTHRTHHLHLVGEGSTKHREFTAFRDHLRRNEDARERYKSLKQQLATQHAMDRGAYTEAKSAFVRGILKVART